jgi:hypothetical protein
VGVQRIEFELGRNGCPDRIPSRITVHRVLVRHGLVDVLVVIGVVSPTGGVSERCRWNCGSWR